MSITFDPEIKLLGNQPKKMIVNFKLSQVIRYQGTINSSENRENLMEMVKL